MFFSLHHEGAGDGKNYGNAENLQMCQQVKLSGFGVATVGARNTRQAKHKKGQGETFHRFFSLCFRLAVLPERDRERI